MQQYDHIKIERKWQSEHKVSYEDKDKKFYVLEMFPYPSGKLHMGHVRNYTLGDVYARFMQMNGYQVLHPMGWDAFGLPAENAARQFGVHPADWTEQNIQEMRTEIKRFGFSYDWQREIKTCDPDYYKHEQEFFIKFFEKGLIYQKESLVNWDPVDNTVLANEQVINGKGWRSGAIVEKKSMRQWFCKITDFADDLLNGIDSLDQWPDSIKSMQRNWIGKSAGAIIKFKISGWNEYIEVFTTRPDTIFGCSFIAIAYNHKAIDLIEKNSETEAFLEECSHDSTSEAVITTKKGVHTNLYVEHPFDASIQIPIYIANFVLSTYGTGAVFGCPAHDERDYEFATKYNLPIKRVVEGGEEGCYTGDGTMINSAFLDGMHNTLAKSEIIKRLQDLQIGHATIIYRLHDWGISRQKYWGCPIPIIYCSNCGAIPVALQDLPVKLPLDIDVSVQGNPLSSHPTWKHVDCHRCGAAAERETDTLDTFFESSWYFARFCTRDKDKAIDKEMTNKWMPVDCYIGGSEHAVMHLLYARFFTKALKKCGYWDFEEPFKRLYTQGMVCSAAYKDSKDMWVEASDVESLNGKYYMKSSNEEVFFVGHEKMSKSKKNGVKPEVYIERFGADTLRMFVMSDSPPNKDLNWNDDAVEGVSRYLQRLYKTAFLDCQGDNHDAALEQLQHRTIARVTEDYNDFHINKAIARVRELNNALNDAIFKGISNSQKISVMKTIVELLHPIIPHITAEILEAIGCGNRMAWPQANAKFLVDNVITVVVQVNGKLRSTLVTPKNSPQFELEKRALELLTVKNAIAGKSISKVIYVQDKILNFIC